MSRSATRERILDAAEVLFAEKGFAETSLRAITSRAGVNLAAVNYHFGAKEALIQSVFERFLDPFCDELARQLDAQADNADLDQLLELVTRTALRVHRNDPHRLGILFRLAGLAYTQAQGHLRVFLGDRYGQVFRRFTTLLAGAAPDLPPVVLFWRAHFSLGAAMFALSGLDSLRAISTSEFGRTLAPNEIHHELLDFIAGGIRAPHTG